MQITWQKYCQAIDHCKRCPLGNPREGHAVIGAGSMNSGIMLVGESPSRAEARTGMPFVGPAGEVLDEVLNYLHIPRPDVYICNIIKCRPPENRDPKPEEIVACKPFIDLQIKFLQPKLIICLGRYAASSLIDKKYNMSKQHGIIYHREEYLISSTLHPAATLYNPALKRNLISDMEKIIEFYKENQT